MKIGFAGGRAVADEEVDEVKRVIRKYMMNRITDLSDDFVVLVGGASGVDRLVKEVAKEFSLDVVVFKPASMLNSKVPFTKELFFARNLEICQNADALYTLFKEGDKEANFYRLYSQKYSLPLVEELF